MRLLNTSSLDLKEFSGIKKPPYAILSHTWGEEEVLFEHIQNGTSSSKKAYAKVIGCCRKAVEDGLEWVWIDTCCINKTSSAELSEAINSMYKWYETSAICYVYLQDVASVRRSFAGFSRSRWFKRGWTLQELVAPKAVEFYNSQWEEIGTKGSLASKISAITLIPVRILHGDSPSTCNIAERMSWASARQTTREEDLAYCLLGLFDVNMPLLYGEGAKSFIRLQEHIIKQEEDYSIFAWTSRRDRGKSLTGFLASSPAEFAGDVSLKLPLPKPFALSSQFDEFGANKTPGAGLRLIYAKDYERLRKHDFQKCPAEDIPQEPPQLTARGLRISLPIIHPADPGLPALAWIYYEIDDRLLCIFLEQSSIDSSQLLGRHSSQWL
ncbi:hypothetical protein QQX98_002068, partial [Neonectria punicea]